ncbi:protein-lysine methyltransferase METTL21D isoform X2 [Sinocyclocheilus rhinocerous]|uniref:protein-lysine methyltransferase METTL21D isoform X2 n=1 Tax=Sinocyclocheilus rhinocerous TaxID=307959 RepID=UPI0007B8949C|nr:PREDICTED: protein-lysine methyltransferase METTL21D isoform X2 [Sinocyclocheilus rhinocerous]
MATDEDSEDYFVREIEKNDGSVLRIYQCSRGDVGCVVWDAAIVLSKYLETEQFYSVQSRVSTWRSKNIVELGAGTGLVGLVAATLGANVTVTDLEDLQPLLQLNIKKNQHLIHTGSITAKVLKWGGNVKEFLPHSHYILMADCIYYEQLLLQEFQSEMIPSEKQDPEFNSPDIHMLHLRRRVH